MLQLQLCLQLQQNTMVPVAVDGQICHFCVQVFVTRKWLQIHAASRVYVAQLFYMAASVAVVLIIWERFKNSKGVFSTFPAVKLESVILIPFGNPFKKFIG